MKPKSSVGLSPPDGAPLIPVLITLHSDTPIPADKSYLWYHLKNAIKEVEEVWDLAIGDRIAGGSNTEIEEQLYQMGLGQDQGVVYILQLQYGVTDSGHAC